MTRPHKIYEKLLSGTQIIRFTDFQRVLLHFGFEHMRTRGSHHIYCHTMVDRPLSIQPVKGEAKSYQIKQFVGIIEEFGLKMED